MRAVRFGFGPDRFALSVPTLDIDAGHTVACIGPSGSGKSTLLLLLAGILLPQQGSVAISGVDWSTLSDAQRRLRRITRIGLVFQELELLPHLSVRENVLLPYLVQRDLTIDDGVRSDLAALATSTGITPLLDRRPAALSQGERQRVALCRALITRPPVLLADEPTGNLDPRTTDQVMDLMLREVRSRGATLVMVTHDHGLVPRFDSRVELEADPAENGTAIARLTSQPDRGPDQPASDAP